jgi:hypothetical protein
MVSHRGRHSITRDAGNSGAVQIAICLFACRKGIGFIASRAEISLSIGRTTTSARSTVHAGGETIGGVTASCCRRVSAGP